MKDKTQRKTKGYVLHKGYEGQNTAKNKGICPS
jgi:hypothetical protein